MRIESKEIGMTRSRTHRAEVRSRRWPAPLAQLALGTLAALLAAIALAAPAHAAFGIESFTGEVLDAQGDPATQAGAHPDTASTTIAFNMRADGSGVTDGKFRTIKVDLPPGFVANPTATPRCTVRTFLDTQGTGCPKDTQVGVVSLKLGTFSFGGNKVFNIVPPAGVPAQFAFSFLTNRIFLEGRVRTGGDYGMGFTIANSTAAAPVTATSLTFWGVPADHNGSGASRKPFLSNPTDCAAGLLTTNLAVDSWEHTGTFATASFDHDPNGVPNEVEGCEKLDFQPSLTLAPDHPEAGAPSGYTVDLRLPQDENPDGLATASLEKTVVRLPAGVTVSPSAANGLGACSPSQFGLHSAAPASCPDDSKIGTLQIETPLLPDPLDGSIYLAKQHDNPYGTLLAIYLVAEGSGVVIKIPGRVDPDPSTGQLTATFDDTPQLPFDDFSLHFFGGSRAALVNPPTAGRYTTTTTMTSYSGQTVVSRSSFDIVGQTSRGFSPSLSAGTVDPVANASSPFVLRFSRPDGQQELGSVNGSLPPGLLGVLKSVPLCSAAQGAAGTCPAASRVGHVQVAAGAGSLPVWLPVAGQPEDAVYLTEPYRKGDIAGMSVVVRAVAGPFDLGTVVTKVYLKLRDRDQGIDFQSDPLPRILQGVPLNIREVVMSIDRKGFMVNPTSCAAMATYANVFSQSWAKAPITSRFQVGGCADLPVSPIITAQAGGKGNTRRYTHPALEVAIRQSAAQAHLSKTNVVLPKELNVDLKAPALKAACPRDVYAQDKCSPVATIGTVQAVTPLLREPLKGPAFLIQKKGKLPDIVMRLRNNRMSLDLIGVLDFLKDGRLITRVKGIPDAALSSFVLDIKGGKNGSLLNRTSLCAHKRLVKATFQGQNGKVSRKSPLMHVAGCAQAKGKTAARLRRSSRGALRRASAAASAARGARAAVAQSRALGGRS